LALQIDSIILASTSVFRQQLLREVHIPFRAIAPSADEESEQDLDPALRALARARIKAADLSTAHPHAIVIGADQVMGFEGRCLGKVGDAERARKRLQELSGHVHQLHSAFCLYLSGQALHEQVCSLGLPMRQLSAEEIERYLQLDEWRGTVGCYRIEGAGVHLFDEFVGDHSTIIGLPLIPLVTALRKLGINFLTDPKGPWTITGSA